MLIIARHWAPKSSEGQWFPRARWMKKWMNWQNFLLQKEEISCRIKRMGHSIRCFSIADVRTTFLFASSTGTEKEIALEMKRNFSMNDKAHPYTGSNIKSERGERVKHWNGPIARVQNSPLKTRTSSSSSLDATAKTSGAMLSMTDQF